MPAASAKDHQQQTAKQQPVAQRQGGKGLAMPSVPAWQNGAQQDNTAPLQRKRAEEGLTQLVQQQGIVQRAVKDTVPNGTRIVIENINASDMGDTGVIVRNSQIADHKAVRFDNERNVLYRVHLSEMSPVDPEERELYGAGNTTSVIGLSKPVTITAEIDFSDETYQTANFFAYNDGHKIGKLKLSNSKREGFIITDVYSNLSPLHKVPGLGVLFLNIASRMAQSLNVVVMQLGANRENLKEKHPAPFYARFGFVGPLDAIAVEAGMLGQTFEKYMETYRAPVAMTGNPAAVKEKTGKYLAG